MIAVPPPGFRLLGCQHDEACSDVFACQHLDREPTTLPLAVQSVIAFQARTGLHWSALARLIGVDVDTVYAWRIGRKSPPRYLHWALCYLIEHPEAWPH